MDKTFFNFKLELEPNIIDMLYDLLRMSTIQIITQIMFYMNNSSLSLFNETFIKTFVFINISIIFYYLVVRKVFSFISDDYLNTYFKEDDRPYAGTPPIGSSNNSHRTSLSSGLKTSNTSNNNRGLTTPPVTPPVAPPVAPPVTPPIAPVTAPLNSNSPASNNSNTSNTSNELNLPNGSTPIGNTQ